MARRESIRALASRWRDVEYPALTATRFMAFARTGDRVTWERPCFDRRKKLIAAALGVCEGGDDADLDAAVDGIWLISEETSWVISAHNGETPGAPLPDPETPYLDLFSAQTGMILSLCCGLLCDQLDAVSPLIRRRVGREVERRVLTPFEARSDFWWMGYTRKDLNNWTPWIVSNVMLCACAWVEDVERLRAILERGMKMLDRWLAVVPDDGGCDEGAGYWSMAGGALLDCLDLLERVTGGRMALWGDAKLDNILRYPLNAWLGGDWFVNFADCDARPDIPGERLMFAGRRIGDAALTAFGARFMGAPAAQLDDTPQLWRLLNGLFSPDVDAGEAAPPEDVWLGDLQQRLVRRGHMALAVKGGVNCGGHSHNDCGGFILTVEGAPQIVDAGNMTYTARTFSDARYTLWNTRSMYHNVPLIGGFEQENGPSRGARDVAYLPDGLSLDIAGAYPDAAGVLACIRTVALRDGACVVRDRIVTERPAPIVETFLLRERPDWDGRVLTAGSIRIEPPPGMAVEIKEIPITDPRMAKSFPGSLWRVAFGAPAAVEHDLQFRIVRVNEE